MVGNPEPGDACPEIPWKLGQGMKETVSDDLRKKVQSHVGNAQKGNICDAEKSHVQPLAVVKLHNQHLYGEPKKLSRLIISVDEGGTKELDLVYIPPPSSPEKKPGPCMLHTFGVTLPSGHMQFISDNLRHFQ